MIILKSEKGEVYNLFFRKKHLVGRNGNLELEGDKSVSRQHAAIHISIKDKKPRILLQDLGSKYGTFVNNGIRTSKEIAKNTPTRLEIGDKIRFGQQWNIWTVEESQIVVCTSTLNQSEKAQLKSLLQPLNGILVSDWTDGCTHLTMNNITITLKVVFALASVKPIVSLEYWETLKDIISSRKEEAILDCDDYIPPLVEPSLTSIPVSFKLNNVRKNLFNDIKFVATSSSQYNSALPMVSKAGGTILDGTKTKITEDQMNSEKIVVLQSDSINRRNRNLTETLKNVERNNWRLIPESEIGLSLIFCSTEKYCNPAFDVEFILRQPESQVTIKDEVSILTLETQDLGEENSTQFIDSNSSRFSLNVNDKRTFSESEDEEVSKPVEKVKNSSTKRKLEDSQKPSTSKCLKLDNWLISKKTVPSSSSSNREVITETFPDPPKKKTSSLFAFANEKQNTERGSSSLFSNLNQNSDESSVDVGNKRKRSLELFSSFENPVIPAKKSNTKKRNFFELPKSKAPSRTSLVLFDSNDECLDSVSEKASQLKISSKPNIKSNPVIVPNKFSLSEFIDACEKPKNVEVKQELLEDFSSDVKDVLDKTLVHTLPLIKKPVMSTNTNESISNVGVNYKRFRKNNPYQRSSVHIISTTDLFLYKEDKMGDNEFAVNNSDVS